MKKLTTTLVIAIALTSGLALAAAPAETAAKTEADGCDNHSGACGALCATESAQLSAPASWNADAFAMEADACDIHSGACGVVSESESKPVSKSKTGSRSYSELQSEINRLLAVIDFDG